MQVVVPDYVLSVLLSDGYEIERIKERPGDSSEAPSYKLVRSRKCSSDLERKHRRALAQRRYRVKRLAKYHADEAKWWKEAMKAHPNDYWAALEHPGKPKHPFNKPVVSYCYDAETGKYKVMPDFSE